MDLISLQGEFEPKRIRTYPLDVSDLGATINAVDQIEKEIGIPDLVILNAGTHVAISVETFSAEKLRDLMEVNFIGVVNAFSEIIPRFTSAGEVAAVVASLAGYRGLPTASGYGASKVTFDQYV